MSNQLSLNQLIMYFAQIAAKLKRIHSFGYGPLYDIAKDQAPVYPLMWVEPVPSTLRKDSLILKHKIYIVDLVQKDLTNRQDVLSDSLRTCQEIKAFIFKDFFYDIFPSDESELEPLFEKFDDETEGYSMTLDLQLDWFANVCDIPGLYPSGATFTSGPNYIYVNQTGYLPLAGGVLTGGLTGTSADFQNYFSAGTPLEQIINQFASSANTYTIDAYLSGSTIWFDRNDLANAYSVDLSGITSTGGFSGWTGGSGAGSIIMVNNTLPNTATHQASLTVGMNNNNSGSYSTIAGGLSNVISFVPGAFIGGGQQNVVFGDSSVIVGGRGNSASGLYGFIGGGQNNINSGLYHSSIVGGLQNSINNNKSFIGGVAYNYIFNPYSSIVGGKSNYVYGTSAFIGGGQTNKNGGYVSFIGGGIDNLVNGSNSVIGGGRENSATTTYSIVVGGKNNLSSQSYSFIGGGYNNISSGQGSSIIGGLYNLVSGINSFIGGGSNNEASGNFSFIGGGSNNKASGHVSFIGGGYNNKVSGSGSFIGGGAYNKASGDYSFVGGGAYNNASGPASFIGGGYRNAAIGSHSFVGAGRQNSATTDYSVVVGGTGNTTVANNSIIVGGFQNLVSGNSYSNGTSSSFIGGGKNNIALDGAYGTSAVVVGGNNNFAGGGYYTGSFVGGGSYNKAYGYFSAIIGGKSNKASSDYSIIIAGTSNITSGGRAFIGTGSGNLASASRAFIGTGIQNRASGPDSTIIAGASNFASGQASFIGAGTFNSATTQYSFIGNGFKNRTSGIHSSVLSGKYNVITGSYSSILAGKNITATADETAYVPKLNIQILGTGTSISNLGIDSNGFVVIGNASSRFTGGTVTGLTTFAAGVSATTYFGLPQDVQVSGFTYNNSNQFTIANNTGGTFSATINSVTGLTVNGTLTATSFTSSLVSNTRLRKRFVSVASSATPTINTDNGDVFSLTGLSTNITSLTTNLTGNPVHGDLFSLELTDNGVARTLIFGASFSNTGTLSLPTTTVISTLLRCLFEYNSATSKWEIVAVV